MAPDREAPRRGRPPDREAPAGPGRTLIAGFGNELRGDDGFGLHVIRRLRDAGIGGPSVDLLEVGTAGLRLAQQLLDPYDRLIVVDAIGRGGPPGTVYALAVDAVEMPAGVDLHTAVPARALGVARALGGLPPAVWIVGCEPAEVDELTAALSPAVAAAVDNAVQRVRDLLGGGPPPRRERVDLERRDEVLQVMFWLTGEGLGPDVPADAIARFIGDERAVAAVLAHLLEQGYAEGRDTAGGEPRYRLTPLGEVEGRRRFLDEFAPYLARGAHGGECGSPDCDCHAGGECRNA
jgi:hydrogenase maturation protease